MKSCSTSGLRFASAALIRHSPILALINCARWLAVERKISVRSNAAAIVNMNFAVPTLAIPVCRWPSAAKVGRATSGVLLRTILAAFNIVDRLVPAVVAGIVSGHILKLWPSAVPRGRASCSTAPSRRAPHMPANSGHPGAPAISSRATGTTQTHTGYPVQRADPQPSVAACPRG